MVKSKLLEKLEINLEESVNLLDFYTYTLPKYKIKTGF